MEEHKVKIIEWPSDKAQLEHFFNLDKPCPVSIIFEDKPIQIKVNATQKEPLNVNMNMLLKAKETIPLCIKICEPICATSNYNIGIRLFGQPFADIGVKGVTRLAPCKDEKPQQTTDCQTQDDCKAGKTAPSPYTKEEITYEPLVGDTVSWVALLGPPVTTQIAIPDDGLKISFANTVQQVEVDIVNYGNPLMQIDAYNNNALVDSTTEVIQNTRKRITVSAQSIDSIIIKGGKNEAALIEVCYTEAAPVIQRDNLTHRVSIATHKNK